MAEKEGGKVVMDDRALDMPLAVVALRADLPPEAVRAFQKAIAQAAGYVNANPDAAKARMASLGLIPPALADTYELPAFRPDKIPLRLPDRALFDRYVNWLIKNGALAAPGGADQGGPRPAPRFEDVVFQDHS